MKVALLVAGALAASPPPAPACLSGAEAESLTLVAMPEIIRQTGQVCASRLPATSLVRQPSGSFIAKYQAAADGAWPAARAAIVKLSDPAAESMLQSSFARPLLVSLIVPQLVGRIAPADCALIDRAVTAAAPLPPRSTASLIVTALQYLKTTQVRAGRMNGPELPLCTDVAR